MKGFGLGLVISFLVKGIIKLLDAIFTFIAGLIMYFGIWVPGGFMIYSTGLMIWCGLDLRIAGADRNLFFFGLALSIVCAVIISIRNIILKPLAEYKLYKRAKREFKKCKEQTVKEELYKSNPKKYYAKYAPDEVPSKDDPVFKTPSEFRDLNAPKIYRSKNNTNIIIHEYKDRYDIYRDENGKIFKIDTKIKK